MNELLSDIAEHLRKDITGVTVVEEAKGDVSRTLELAVGKQTLALLVGMGLFTPEKQSNTIIIGKAEIVVSVFEKPVVNQSKAGSRNLLSLAADVVRSLTYEKSDHAASAIFFRRITPISELTSGNGSVITCDVVFDVKTEL